MQRALSNMQTASLCSLKAKIFQPNKEKSVKQQNEYLAPEREAAAHVSTFNFNFPFLLFQQTKKRPPHFIQEISVNVIIKFN